MRPLSFALLALVLASPIPAQKPGKPPLTAVYSYADVADLALAAKQVAHVKIKRAKKLPRALAAGVQAGVTRYLITADVVSLIRGDGGVDPRVTYLVDIATDSQGRGSLVTKGEVVIFAQPGRPGEVQLVTPDAQLPWSADLGSMVRRILTEAVKRDAPPAVSGISAAFHNQGALPGESETQIFLEATRPVSLSVVRAPNVPVNWFVSVGDVVAEGRSPPKRNTLLWYRLACSLPAQLPESVLDEQSAETTAALRLDYAVVIESLGPCRRARPRSS